MTNQNNRGRTFWDLIAEHSKMTFTLILILIAIILLLVFNGYTLKSNFLTLEPEKKLNNKNIQTFDTAVTVKKESFNTSQVVSKQLVNNANSNILNEQKKINQYEKLNNSNPTVSVTSNNQSGGITANQVNIGAVPRNLDEKTQNQLLGILKKKNELIGISSVMGDSEAFKYANQINDFLKSQGYTKVEGVSQSVFNKPIMGQFINKDSIGFKIVIGTKLD
ncbi:hypothetical protein [Flavobacterium gawalongense]|uniref:Uncharacterized protein n=1 Tax=Flavobacterium gawalongense TaxID=2594432 RepID=A0A553BLR2_9FLAO|nr:hypothetical protein [Flavobacterium gawalongense]TRX01200.1 hypothetical protein FNW33_09865 [Flavobacterium gawalongense]TRX05275.1 hypothetical protein FNW12_11465 [Flavobacterium gawalongense]TRX09178.1 hypothetical protein FNW10_11775 [Flavobacterium gawalongense]TRX09187.1 hypothetical protein FNW11_09610 [Flavobacterium gawalongense]TRX26644.1 hypothetical protein FNW38_10525 [Flavobacterium gawalongense]